MYYQSKFDYCPVRPLTPNDGYHYFFGYYDLNAYHINGKYHLAHRVEFMDRLPEKDDICTLGQINLETGAFEPFAETTAWNFQQGALLTYNVSNYDEVFYNVRMGDGYATCRHNLVTGEKKYTDRPCTNISRDGKRGFALNFDRIYDFRPGYGYAGNRDPWFDVNAPEDDGIFLVDMESGKSRLLVSVAEIIRRFPHPDFKDAKFVVNHINFNPAGDRYVILFRNFGGEGISWTTCLIAGDLEGNMKMLIPYNVASHYHWRDNESLVIYAKADGVNQTHYYINTVTGEYEMLTDPILKRNWHCLFSPDRRYFIGDGYPREESRRFLHICDCATEKIDVLLEDYSTPEDNTDLRCDLHNRFNPQGTKISFDSTRNGRREILELNLSEFLKQSENKTHQE